MAGRYTNKARIDRVINQLLNKGWKMVPSRKGWKLTPPEEVLKLNPQMGTPYITVHRTYSDSRSDKNFAAEVARWSQPISSHAVQKTVVSEDLDTETVTYFCRHELCWPNRDFNSLESLEAHYAEVHPVRPGHLWTKGEGPKVPTHQCPICDWNKDGRAFRKHIKRSHPEHWTRVRGDLLTNEGLEQSASLSWTPITSLPEMRDFVQAFITQNFEMDSIEKLKKTARVLEAAGELYSAMEDMEP